VQRQLLLEQADSAGITLTSDDWGLLRVQHDSAIAILGAVVGVTPQALHDSGVSVAMARVDDYLSRAVRGQARFFPIPPFLGETLRARNSWSVDQAGVRRALERAKEIRATADSAGAGAAPRMTPAPGPAPVDTTPRRRGQ